MKYTEAPLTRDRYSLEASMDEIEPMRAISANEQPSAPEPIAAAGDFRSAPKRGRLDLSPGKLNGNKHTERADDEVILSDVAHVSLLEEEGKSVNAIAADLGLTAEAVLSDLEIAAEICHSRDSENCAKVDSATPTYAAPLGSGDIAFPLPSTNVRFRVRIPGNA